MSQFYTNESRLTLTIALEILYGCNFSCNGCAANTRKKQMPTDADLDMLYDLSLDLSKHYQLEEIELAPTDFMTSLNRKEVVNNRGIQKLYSIYDTVEINSTFLYPKRDAYKEMADDVNTLKANGNLGIIVPFELKHVSNQKYIDTLSTHLQWFDEALGRKPKTYEIMFTVGLDALSALSYRVNIEKLYEMYDKYMRLEIHPAASFFLNISGSRRFLNDEEEKKKVKQAIRTLNKLYQLDLERNPTGWREDHFTRNHQVNPIKKTHEYAGVELFWLDGKVYHTPALYNYTEVVSDLLEFKGKTGADFLADYDRMLVECLNIAGANPDCNVCPHVMRCTQKHTQVFAKELDINQCVFTY